MSFLRKLLGTSARADAGLYFHVRCSACGESIRVRADQSTDLSPLWEGVGDSPTGYEFNKEILGNSCPRLLYGQWRFDSSRRLISGSVEGGSVISAEEYEAALARVR